MSFHAKEELSLGSVMEHEGSNNHGLTFIEGFNSETLNYLENDLQTNTSIIKEKPQIDLIINCSLYVEGFMFDSPNKLLLYQKMKQLKTGKGIEQNEIAKDEAVLYMKIPTEQKKEISSMGGEIIKEMDLLEAKYTNISSNPIPLDIDSVSLDQKSVNGAVCTFDVLKRNEIADFKMSEEHKKFMDTASHRKNLRNKRIMKNL
eukprot:CAMPEP_0170530114 /NCGR_PEP_ID=MMETSP0209-20121228/41138_1 /TAXON_ID=665100 ORGANISM="Litonotus pictus, Strain P1" /NCGR_SAMPLE_ID=MMETSP0209 /ASSEMBLY_ACC=CAM_ASM_000301 /LENGTH=202 /DNA_ID=CAMNT_0010822855 /DNA_START=500 /DNA_END=1105 /DNA_ORIENTATION=+